MVILTLGSTDSVPLTLHLILFSLNARRLPSFQIGHHAEGHQSVSRTISVSGLVIVLRIQDRPLY